MIGERAMDGTTEGEGLVDTVESPSIPHMALSCDNPVIAAAVAYWQSKHRGDRPPRKKDLDPVIDIPRVVPHLVLVEKHGAPPTLTYRLVGGWLVEICGCNLTGRSVTHSCYTEDWQVTARDYWTCLETLQPALRTGSLCDRFRRTVAVDRIMLPLVDEAGAGAMVLGVLAPTDARKWAPAYATGAGDPLGL